jgi:hypothetical protein
MPNFDGGHYFLTVLAPIRTDVLVPAGGVTCSPVSAVFHALATLPTALQSPVTQAIGINSPFSRNRRTHFARFAVLTDVVFNGRVGGDSIHVAISGTNPTVAQPVDELNCPYLMFTADFDARSGEESELRSYLDELWRTMETELRDIFDACIGYSKNWDSRAFQNYILRCQVETTMPFNDYWVGTRPLPTTNKWVLIGPALVAAVVFLISLVLWLLGFRGWPWGTISVVALVAVLAGIAFAYRMVMSRGAKPFPQAPGSDLRSVLKALYLQQKFGRFAIDNQGVTPQALHRAFGEFLGDHRPTDLERPTQAPGVIRA